jgi:predicted DNA-binding protein
MAKSSRPSRGRAGTPGKVKGARQAITLRLDPPRYERLERLARAENRTLTNYVEAAVLRDMEAKEEAARAITMLVPEDAAHLVPGPLARTEGESDERYAERSALMDTLFAIPDAG